MLLFSGAPIHDSRWFGDYGRGVRRRFPIFSPFWVKKSNKTKLPKREKSADLPITASEGHYKYYTRSKQPVFCLFVFFAQLGGCGPDCKRKEMFHCTRGQTMVLLARLLPLLISGGGGGAGGLYPLFQNCGKSWFGGNNPVQLQAVYPPRNRRRYVVLNGSIRTTKPTMDGTKKNMYPAIIPLYVLYTVFWF